MLSTSICAAICGPVRLPMVPSVTTWKYTGTDVLKFGPARPLAELGRSACTSPRSGSRTSPPRPRTAAPDPCAAAAAVGSHDEAGEPTPAPPPVPLDGPSATAARSAPASTRPKVTVRRCILPLLSTLSGGSHGNPSSDGPPPQATLTGAPTDRKSTRLNSSHVAISYAVFCLKKKNERLRIYPFTEKTYIATGHR